MCLSLTAGFTQAPGTLADSSASPSSWCSGMHRRTLVTAALAAAFAFGTTGAAAQTAGKTIAARAPADEPQGIETSGIKFAPTVQVGGQTLVLNGAGTRYKVIFKAYTCGLYLPHKADTVEEALAMPGPKRVHLVSLRSIDANELGRMFTRSMQDNASKEDFSKSVPGTIALGNMFAEKKNMEAGESIGVDYIPGVGTQAMVNGKPFGQLIKEPEFFTSLLRIWLGERPADRALKQALLGHDPNAPQTAGL